MCQFPRFLLQLKSETFFLKIELTQSTELISASHNNYTYLEYIFYLSLQLTRTPTYIDQLRRLHLRLIDASQNLSSLSCFEQHSKLLNFPELSGNFQHKFTYILNQLAVILACREASPSRTICIRPKCISTLRNFLELNTSHYEVKHKNHKQQLKQ